MKQKTGRKLLSFLLTLAMVMGQMPGMSLTALADGTTYSPASEYTDYGTLNSNDTTVQIEGVKIGDTIVDWYVIDYNSTDQTVTLLSKQSFASKEFSSSDSNFYASSEIKTYVEGLIGEGQPLAGIKDALADISGKVTGDPDNISGAVPYLLSYAEANALSTTKKLGDGWWLRSPDKSDDYYVASAFNGYAYEHGYYVGHKHAVRPALKLNLSSVTFSTDTNTFTVGSATVAVTGVSLDKTTAQTIELDGKVSFTATVAPDNATDKKVKWSVGGTGAGAVKLYSDEACTTEVGADATETLTVYAKGISAGSATVTATSNADSTKTASCAVTVNEAEGEKAYAAYDVTTETNKTKNGDDLTALQVTFNGRQWYIIEDNSSSATSGTVTLLSADTSFGTKTFDNVNKSKKYSTSQVKDYLDSMTGTGGAFADVAEAIETVNLTTNQYIIPNTPEVYETVNGVKLYLLSTEEASSLPENVRKAEFNVSRNEYTSKSKEWWLRSPGSLDDNSAAFVDGADGFVTAGGDYVGFAFGVRPALQLNLSKVTFDSATNTMKFTVVEEPSTYTLTIPATLTVANAGWNATSGISATGTLASGKKLTVTASSDGEFALVNQSDSTQKVGYKLATASTDTEATTSWEFTELSSTATKKDMGIIVEDYSTKPAGTYQDTVTFTASVVNASILSGILVNGSTFEVDFQFVNNSFTPPQTFGYEIELTNNNGVYQCTKYIYNSNDQTSSHSGDTDLFTVNSNTATLKNGASSFTFGISDDSYTLPDGWTINAVKLNSVNVLSSLTQTAT